MKIQTRINLKTIIVLIAIVLFLVFFACYEADPPLRIGIWEQSEWDIDAWGD